MKRTLIVALLIVISLALVWYYQYNTNKPDSWKAGFGLTGTNSSPRAVDLNADGVLDIVLGAGGTEWDSTENAVIALNGKNGELLWSVSGPNQVVGSALFKDINGDNTQDVFIGGRSAQLYAIDGKTGKVIWQYLKGYVSDNVHKDTTLLNFFNPQFIPDQNKDGVEDILTAFGGYPSARAEDHNRPSGRIMVIDAKTGNVIKEAFTPDRKETYMSPIIYDFKNGSGLTVIIGTGGETISGGLYAIPLPDFMKTGLKKVVKIDSGLQKGFIAPPIIADITKDGIGDIIAIGMDCILRAYDGAGFDQIWLSKIHPNAESQSAPCPVYFNDDDVLDFFCTINIGKWPDNHTAIHAIFSGVDGQELFRDTLGILQFSSPVLMDFNEDAHHDIVYQINKRKAVSMIGNVHETQLLVYNGKTGEKMKLDSTFSGKNLGSTSLITDLDQDNKVDIVYTYMTEHLDLHDYKNLVIKRIELDVKFKDNPWGGYMGTDFTSVYPE